MSLLPAILLVALAMFPAKGGADYNVATFLNNKIQFLQNSVNALTAEVNRLKQNNGHYAAFYADFGNAPFKEVSILPHNTLRFDRVRANYGNGYNALTGRFTAPYSGIYSFDLHFMGPGSQTSSTQLSIMKDTVALATGFAEGGKKDSNDQGHASAVVYLAKGQNVRVASPMGLSKVWGSFLTSFSGVLIHAL